MFLTLLCLRLTCTITGWTYDEISTTSSVGSLNPNCIGKIVSPDGQELPRGERGEVWMQAPNVMKGYWKNEKATAETLTPDRWLRTGDIGYVDKTGKWYIVDRMKVCICSKTLRWRLELQLMPLRSSLKSRATKSPPQNSRLYCWIIQTLWTPAWSVLSSRAKSYLGLT
jgi:acyl-CoA synthetase (AMP-forming)/AMP-acid ligase II